MLKSSQCTRTSLQPQAFPTNFGFLKSQEWGSDFSADLYQLIKGQLEMQQLQVKRDKSTRAEGGKKEQEETQKSDKTKRKSPCHLPPRR